ncbi:MAG: hypothetical protein KJ600_04320 [Nanoarchaeota archaeon]|nr:hypothetical protein [Nanoarchaeota archaeon]MBU1103753.1 hypothetical protein [Nanoarchaeota archaeon]
MTTQTRPRELKVRGSYHPGEKVFCQRIPKGLVYKTKGTVVEIIDPKPVPVEGQLAFLRSVYNLSGLDVLEPSLTSTSRIPETHPEFKTVSEFVEQHRGTA